MAETQCSRCAKELEEYDPTQGFTSGYYVVASGFWSRFANPGEQFLCDACMWRDPAYRAENANAVPLPPEEPT